MNRQVHHLYMWPSVLFLQLESDLFKLLYCKAWFGLFKQELRMVSFQVVSLVVRVNQVLDYFFSLPYLYRTHLAQVKTRMCIPQHALALNNSLQTCDKQAHRQFGAVNLNHLLCVIYCAGIKSLWTHSPIRGF